MRHISQILCLAVLLCLQAAADLPAWTDDSSVVLRSDSVRIAAGQGQARLTAAVFHPLDTAMLVSFTFSVKNEQGTAVRTFSGGRTFQPGEPMEFSTTFDGRDAAGHVLSSGFYTVEVTVDLSSASPAGTDVLQRSASSDTGEAVQRTDRIVQKRSMVLEIGSAQAATVTSGSAVVTTSQVGQDPAFPFNHYYGILHTQTTYSDGGHPNDSNCAASTTHAAGDFTPAQAYDYARNTAHLDFLGVTDHNHLFENACPSCTAAQVIQRYHDGLAAAAAANVDGTFVAIYGMEWASSPLRASAMKATSDCLKLPNCSDGSRVPAPLAQPVSTRCSPIRLE